MTDDQKEKLSNFIASITDVTDRHTTIITKLAEENQELHKRLKAIEELLNGFPLFTKQS